MGTIGNLELRIGKNTIYASTTHDGYRAYEIIPKLADYLDENPFHGLENYIGWFKKTAEELLPFRHSEELLGGAPCEVIIDTARKLILHNANQRELRHFDADKLWRLKVNHKYQFLEFKNKLLD